MSQPAPIHFASLSPDLILSAIESLKFQCSGHLLALNSFENRVYQIGILDSEYPYIIAKFYRPQRWTNEAILEEHQFGQEIQELDIPVIAPLTLLGRTLHQFEDHRFALFPKQSGRALELGNQQHLEWMGRFIGRLHAMGACRPFLHRSQLNVESYGLHSVEFLIKNHFIPRDLIRSFSEATEEILKMIDNNFKRIKPTYIRLHGDCHPGNVLWNDAGPHIVDLDDCLMGPAVQDIWMLLFGNEEQMNGQLSRILDGYSQFHDFNPKELQLIPSLRILRMLQYSAWLAKRWEDPTFPHHFPFFNTPHYWQEFLQNLKIQKESISI